MEVAGTRIGVVSVGTASVGKTKTIINNVTKVTIMKLKRAKRIINATSRTNAITID